MKNSPAALLTTPGVALLPGARIDLSCGDPNFMASLRRPRNERKFN
jgi:hypothetical protein